MEKINQLLQEMQHMINAKVASNKLITKAEEILSALHYIAIERKEEKSKSIVVQYPYTIIQSSEYKKDPVIPATTIASSESPKQTTQVLFKSDPVQEAKKSIDSFKETTMVNEPATVTSSIFFTVPIKPKKITEPLPVHETIQTNKNTSTSLHDTLLSKQQQTEIATQLSNLPIQNLRKSITIIDRFQYIEQLFQNKEAAFEECINAIDNCLQWEEAKKILETKYISTYQWDVENIAYKNLIQSIKRRFSVI